MTSVLVFLVHCDPSLAPRYRAALQAVGFDADVVALVAPGTGLSARYDALAGECLQSGNGSAVRGLAARYKPPRSLASYEHVILATYSAGYGFARHLSSLDRAMLSGLALVDSGHSAEGSPGTSIDWLVGWAKDARAGRKVLVIGHTDVDPVTYASTTEVAQAAIDRSGAPLDELELYADEKAAGLKRRRRQGLFVVESYDRRPTAQAKGEHGDALTVWGSTLVQQAACMALLIPHASGAVTPADADHDTLPGVDMSAKATVALPHGYRCSVAELVADAKALGTWRPADAGIHLHVGDLIVSARSGGDPTKGGPGHVERFANIDERGVIWTIGGNEQNRWVEAPYDLMSPDARGVIVVPAEIGARAVEIARAELKAGVKETPGPKATLRISEYHAGARRGGSPVAGMPGHEKEGAQVLGEHASDEIPWCASSASWCCFQAAKG